MEKAREHVEHEVARSTIFDLEAVEALSKFSPEEVGLGRVVGRGGFCVVRECASIKLLSLPSSSAGAAADTATTITIAAAGSPAGESTGGPNAIAAVAPPGTTNNAERGNVTPDSSLSLRHRPVQHAASFPNEYGTAGTSRHAHNWSNLASSEHGLADQSSGGGGQRLRQRRYPSEGLESFSSNQVLSETREQLARRVWAKRGSHRYVVKKVEPELFHEDRLTYFKGVVDLALETYYLASLSTQHPQILRIRGVAATGPYQPGYFIVLDRLNEVLSKRLNAWMHRHRSTKGLTGAFTGGRRKVKDLLIERLLVATDVASAMEFLHSRNVIYRDLKPDNVGFDADGSVKIFDFGLAKELSEDEKDEDGLYHMTGFTGTGVIARLCLNVLVGLAGDHLCRKRLTFCSPIRRDSVHGPRSWPARAVQSESGRVLVVDGHVVHHGAGAALWPFHAQDVPRSRLQAWVPSHSERQVARGGQSPHEDVLERHHRRPARLLPDHRSAPEGVDPDRSPNLVVPIRRVQVVHSDPGKFATTSNLMLTRQ